MRITNLLLISLLISLLLSACGESGTATDTPNNETETTNTTTTNPAATTAAAVTAPLPPQEVGYLYGIMIARRFSEQMGLSAEEMNMEQIMAGITKGLEGDKNLLDESVKVLRTRLGNPQATPAATPEEANKIAYNLGVSMTGSFQQLNIPANTIDVNAVKEGYEATKAGTPKYTDQEAQQKLNQFFNAYQEAKAASVIEAGRQFLAENAKKEGIVTLPSGLQYKIIEEGNGAKPTINDKVKTHYHGTLIDGSIFDSSMERGEPTTFPVNGVIKGWQEGIPLMSLGAKYKFFIPQELAYGMQAPSPKIPAGSALIFDVELIEINPAQ